MRNNIFYDQNEPITPYNNKYFRPPRWLSHFRARIYLRQILLQITIEPNHHVLEVGCDHGQLTDLLRQFSTTVIGIDINPIFIKKSNKRYLQNMDAQSLKFPDNFFDLIVSSHTIEHIPDIQRSLCEMARVLKSGAYIVLIYPWEPIRGWTVLPEAIFQYQSLTVCRQFHLHNLTPQKIGFLVKKLSLVHRTWKVFFVPHPNFISVIQKF